VLANLTPVFASVLWQCFLLRSYTLRLSGRRKGKKTGFEMKPIFDISEQWQFVGSLTISRERLPSPFEKTIHICDFTGNSPELVESSRQLAHKKASFWSTFTVNVHQVTIKLPRCHKSPVPAYSRGRVVARQGVSDLVSLVSCFLNSNMQFHPAVYVTARSKTVSNQVIADCEAPAEGLRRMEGHGKRCAIRNRYAVTCEVVQLIL
jgi:hypothetical protein